MPQQPAVQTLQTIASVLQTRQRKQLIRPHLKPAAVLLPLFELEGSLHLLFTLRTEKVRHHKGQVSFPGGSRHSQDLDLLQTALRETEEEIGIDRQQINVLGALDDLCTVTSYLITPYVGTIPWPVGLQPSPDEIADVFWVPLDRLTDERLCRVEELTANGVTYYPIYYFEGGQHRIWGVSGHILSHFLEVTLGWRYPHLQADRVNLRYE